MADPFLGAEGKRAMHGCRDAVEHISTDGDVGELESDDPSMSGVPYPNLDLPCMQAH